MFGRLLFNKRDCLSLFIPSVNTSIGQSESCYLGFNRHREDAHDKWKEDVHDSAHPAFIRCHSYCVYSSCAEVSDDDSSLHVDSLSVMAITGRCILLYTSYICTL